MSKFVEGDLVMVEGQEGIWAVRKTDGDKTCVACQETLSAWFDNKLLFKTKELDEELIWFETE